MNAHTFSFGSIARVVALAASFAVPLSYAIFVQAGQLVADQRSIYVEVQGNRCLADAYAILHDVVAVTSSADADERRLRDSLRFDTAGCAKGLNGWPALRSQLSRSALREADRGHLADAMVNVINTLASNTNLLYDPHPAVLNLANAAGYDLPKTQTLLIASASEQDPVDSARYEATAKQLLLSTRYDVASAISYGRELESVLALPMQRSLSLGTVYDAQIEAWQNAGTSRARFRRKVAIAERRAIDQNDVVYGLIQRSVATQLASEAAANEMRLHVLWFAYACALAASLFIAWLISSFVTRRERRVLAQLQQERSRLKAESERDRAESELAVREARFQAIFAESPLPIAISDMHGTIVECNEAYLRLVGASAADGRPRTLLDSLSTEPSDALEEMYGDLRAGTVAAREADLILRRRNQERVWCHAIVSPVASDDGPPKHCSVMLQDITERIEREQHFRHGAMHDYLTGLPNRAALIALLERQLERDSAAPRFALLFIDVDDFKSINDTLGHAAGDESLVGVAAKLSAIVRETDTVARYGGDEFVLLLVHPLSVANAQDIAERIARALARPFAVGEVAITITLSVGVIVDRIGYTSAEQVLVDADAAMYQVKLSGVKRVVSFRGLRRSAPA